MPRSKHQTEQMRTESREKILSTARRLFAEKGYDGCNVSDIAREAEMSQGNIYWYFPSKKEIYTTILTEGFAELGTVMAEAASGTGTAVEKLDSFLDKYFSLMKAKGGEEFASIVGALMAQGGVQRMAELGFSTHQIGAGYHQSLNIIFAQGQAEGVFLQGVDPNLLSAFFFSFSNGLRLWYPGDWKTFPEDVLRQAVRRLVGMNTG